MTKDAKAAVVALAHDLLDNVARVQSTSTEDAYVCLLAQQCSKKIARHLFQMIVFVFYS